MDLLARREHSRKELNNKLISRGYDQNEVNTALDKLVEDKLLDDARFTEMFVLYRTKKGQGPIRISKELQERGISTELQDEFLDNQDPVWLDNIKQVREKKFGKAQPADFKQSAKQARFLQYRGYTSEQIRRVINHNDDE